MENVYEKKYKTEIPMQQKIWDPRNWTTFSYINFIFSILLIIDWIVGLIFPESMIYQSYLYSAFPEMDLFSLVIPIISLVVIMLLSPLLSEKLDKSPFFTAIGILVKLSTCVNQHTIIGRVGELIVSLSCSVILVLNTINMTVLENEGPISNIGAMIIGVGLLMLNLLTNIVLFGLRINEIWGIIFVAMALLGTIIISLQRIKLGAIPIFVACVLNDYVFQFGLGGFNAGAELLKFFSLFLVVYDIIRK